MPTGKNRVTFTDLKNQERINKLQDLRSGIREGIDFGVGNRSVSEIMKEVEERLRSELIEAEKSGFSTKNKLEILALAK